MRVRPQDHQKNKEATTMTRKKMIAYYMWLLSQGDNEAAKEVEYSFFDLWGESIFDYI
jgi:hypothetical protein